MKTLIFILPLAGAALLASAGEPADANTSSSNRSPALQDITISSPSSSLDAADRAQASRIGDKLVLSGALTQKPVRTSRSILNAINPFAPVAPQPKTPWLSRAAWSTAATKAAGDSTPVDVRHESQISVVIASR